MSEYGDTGDSPEVEPQAAESSLDNVASDDIDDYEPEVDAEGKPQPIPYDRFKESRAQLADARSEVTDVQSRMAALEAQNQQLQQYSQQAYAQLQQAYNQMQSAPSSQEEEYVDPLEKKVQGLEQKLHETAAALSQAAQWRQEALIKEAQHEIKGEINQARQKYGWADERDILEGLRVNPNASVAELAKRSHRKQQEIFDKRASSRGMRSPPKSLQRSAGQAAPGAMDFGDDLEQAEAGAIAYLESLG